MKNPFPGMNPFFEQQWRDAHTSLVLYLRDALQDRLPADLVARAEEDAIAVDAYVPATAYRPDVQVREACTLQEPAAAVAPTQLPRPTPPPAGASIPPTPTPVTEPIRVRVEDEIERWLEIREATGRLVTVLELLSPSNKIGSAERERYARKRRGFVGARANLVEIDLIRQGAWVFAPAVREVLRHAGATYAACVFRATRPAEQEVYPVSLRERLPCIAVPLRPTDADVALDLQPLIDQCHERGRYHLLDYRVDPEPAFAPDDAAWVNQRLKEPGLRDAA